MVDGWGILQESPMAFKRTITGHQFMEKLVSTQLVQVLFSLVQYVDIYEKYALKNFHIYLSYYVHRVQFSCLLIFSFIH